MGGTKTKGSETQLGNTRWTPTLVHFHLYLILLWSLLYSCWNRFLSSSLKVSKLLRIYVFLFESQLMYCLVRSSILAYYLFRFICRISVLCDRLVIVSFNMHGWFQFICTITALHHEYSVTTYWVYFHLQKWTCIKKKSGWLQDKYYSGTCMETPASIESLQNAV